MTEQSDEREAVEQAPVDGGFGWFAGVRLTGTPAMEEPEGADDNGGLEWDAEKGVGPAAMMLKGSDRAFDGPENVEVRGFGCERHDHGGVGCFAVEPCAGEADSGQ